MVWGSGRWLGNFLAGLVEDSLISIDRAVLTTCFSDVVALRAI